MKTHKNLEVWKKSIDLVTKLYEIILKFSTNEQYGIINQIRRASVSIPTNIAEGAARNHRKEFIQFVGISLGSASELETLMIISKNPKYLDEESYTIIKKELDRIFKMLINLHRALSCS